MAILNNFEVTVLLPHHRTSNSASGISTTTWLPITEHDPIYPTTNDQDPSASLKKYIGITPVIESPEQHHYEFAIDFRVHCGFTFIDGDDAQYIVFRTYLDNIKIGSAFVRRERWERSGTYRVRKNGRRYWVDELESWVQKPWEFESGLHGTLRIEVWRECGRPASSGSWDHPDFFGEGNIYDSGNAIALNEFDVTLPKSPRVRHTRKVDLWPMATFVYEYRSEATLKILGMNQGPKSAATSTIDLTEVDDERPTGELTSIATTSYGSDDLQSRFDSNATTSDPMDHDSVQHVQDGYSKGEFDDDALTSSNSWDFSSVMQEDSGYQRLSGYHEQSYERTDVLTKPFEAQLQETNKDINQAAIEIVDLTC